MADTHAPSGWRRWLFSTNHKDIGTMYLIFSICFGVIGGLFSVLIRMELGESGAQVLGGDHQLFNVLISAHGLIWLGCRSRSSRSSAKAMTIRQQTFSGPISRCCTLYG